MSAQAYTNKRRILAEASVLKIQYPKFVATKNNLVATIDCNQAYDTIMYKDVCMCVFNGYGTIYPKALFPTNLDGGNSNTTNIQYFFSGGNNSTNSPQIFSGGSS
jgi:hypothetical protein